jgi:3-oxoacyl-[acyl-carrier protein] reductase
MTELKNKFALVSGASGDLGSAIAMRLARLGADVAIVGRTKAKLDHLAREIKRETGRSIMIGQYDLREANAPAAVIKETIAKFDGLDIVVTCAGDFKRVDVASATRQDWEDAFSLMFFSAVCTVTAAWPYLKARKGNVVMLSGLRGIEPHGESIISGSICAAILNFAKGIAETGIGDDVSVNCVAPGWIAGRRLDEWLDSYSKERGIPRDQAQAIYAKEFGVRRFGTPTDVANVVELLVTEKGSYFQGTSLLMDGGVSHGI